MSSFSSIPMINIQIWISKSLAVSGPSIKFDQVCQTLTKVWPCHSLNPVVWLWPYLTIIILSPHTTNPTIRFQIYGWRVIDICYVTFWLCSLNLIIQLSSNFRKTYMSPYSSILMIKIRIWLSQSLAVSGPSIKFDQVWPTLTIFWLRLSLNSAVWLWP